MYMCPVCGYGGLRRPADDGIICPCCGTEFGYSDATKSHAQLRSEWLMSGGRWYSVVTPPPSGWNLNKQLANLRRLEQGEEHAIATATKTGHIQVMGSPTDETKVIIGVGIRVYRTMTEATQQLHAGAAAQTVYG